MSTASSSRGRVGGDQRYRHGVVCPICGGSEDDDRGTGSRCFGYIGSDGVYAHCTREEKAGGLPQHPNSNTFAHRLKGECKCGIEHAAPEPIVSKRKAKSKGPIDREYDYLDESGSLLFQVVRYKSKDFVQRRPNGTGGWEWKLGDTRRVLYRLPELVAADPTMPVFVVEGEKDVDNLRAIGLVATCNPMGTAGGWKSEYNDHLAGRTVYIIADNDEGGREHALRVALSVHKLAKLVKLVELDGLPPKGDVSDWLTNGGDAEQLLEIISEAPAWTPVRVHAPDDGRGDEPPDAETPEHQRPSTDASAHSERVPIEVSTRQDLVVKASIKALRKDPNLYRRGNDLVTVVREDDDLVHLTTRTAMKNMKGSPKIIPLAEQVVGERLTKVADLYQWRKTKGGEEVAVPVHPPSWLVANISRRQHWPGIRPLIAVAECPFPRPDGSIVETPGYDPGTAILYAPSMDFPRLPEHPTRDDARECWARIRRKVRHYPFASEDDEVVVLAGMFNVLARHGIIGPMPGIAVNGNRAGTGKGFLVDAMVIPGTGRSAPISKYPHDPAEAGKVKTSIVASGKTVVSFDNLAANSRYGGEDLDSLLTARVTDDRLLGLSKNTGDLIVRLTCFVNGNNIEPAKDAYRRWLVCNIVTTLEHPERRNDILDEHGDREPTPDVLMLEDRATVVRDLLTILRSHANAGWPNEGWAPLGSFDHWDKVVRGAVWFATDRDCATTQFKAAEQSEEHRDSIALFEGLWELPQARFGSGRGVTTAEVIEILTQRPDQYEKLRQVMKSKSRSGQLADASRSVGKMLGAMRNSTHGGFKLVQDEKPRHNAAVWLIQAIKPPEANCHAASVDAGLNFAETADHENDWTESNGVWDPDRPY